MDPTAKPLKRLLIATGNAGKLREVRAVLEREFAAGGRRIEIELLGLPDLPAPPPEPHEDGTTFAENARLKALYYARLTGLPTLADDSGLEVDALGGQPGVHSARYAGVSGPREAVDRANNQKLISALRGIQDEKRTARFRCALAMAHDGRVLAESQGVIEGRIMDEPRGTGGFGYDPHFFVDALGCTTAELPSEEKNRFSHRGQALRAMAEMLRRVCEAGAAQPDVGACAEREPEKVLDSASN